VFSPLSPSPALLDFLCFFTFGPPPFSLKDPGLSDASGPSLTRSSQTPRTAFRGHSDLDFFRCGFLPTPSIVLMAPKSAIRATEFFFKWLFSFLPPVPLVGDRPLVPIDFPPLLQNTISHFPALIPPFVPIKGVINPCSTPFSTSSPFPSFRMTPSVPVPVVRKKKGGYVLAWPPEFFCLPLLAMDAARPT